MKNLKLKTLQFKILEKSYADRLKTLDYSKSGIYYMPLHIRDFLNYIENKGITDINQVTDQNIKDWINRLKNRKNQRRTGGISHAHINKHISALNNFARYLKETQTGDIPANTAYLRDEETRKINVLTVKETEKLYQACELNIYGLRDQAMLSIYYGCGLRKKEGINLNTTDLLFNKKLLHVKKSKTGRERLVPMNTSVMQSLNEYISRSRPILLSGKNTETALFISQRTKRISGAGMITRLKKLTKKADLPDRQAGITKEIGLHTLRHSIATHLLQSGMKLEDISKFLGHKSMDSTQIYTHLSIEY